MYLGEIYSVSWLLSSVLLKFKRVDFQELQYSEGIKPLLSLGGDTFKLPVTLVLLPEIISRARRPCPAKPPPIKECLTSPPSPREKEATA
jgi:hypothetical protein